MTAAITGIGWINAGGIGCGKEQRHFDMPEGILPNLTGKTAFSRPCPRFGRMDRYTQLGLSAIAFALRDAGIELWDRKRNIGIIATTVNGCLDTDIRYYDTVISEAGKLASPSLFAYTLPSTFLGEAAIQFGLQGTSFTISESSDSSLWGLRMALINLATDEFDKMLCGICEIDCPSFYSKFGRKIPGALFLLLEKRDSDAKGSYGDLRLSGNGDIVFNGNPVKNILCLTRDCIAAFHNKIVPEKT